MAVHIHFGAAVEIVGYRAINGTYELCCRYADGRCQFAGLPELMADNGLAEIEEAYRQVLGYSPWDRIARLARATH